MTEEKQAYTNTGRNEVRRCPSWHGFLQDLALLAMMFLYLRFPGLTVLQAPGGDCAAITVTGGLS